MAPPVVAEGSEALTCVGGLTYVLFLRDQKPSLYCKLLHAGRVALRSRWFSPKTCALKAEPPATTGGTIPTGTFFALVAHLKENPPLRTQYVRLRLFLRYYIGCSNSAPKIFQALSPPFSLMRLSRDGCAIRSYQPDITSRGTWQPGVQL